MKTKPTWTRYGKGVIMMNRQPAKSTKGEGEEQPLKPKEKPSPKHR